MNDQATHDHLIQVYKDGKYIGFLTSNGYTNRLRIHAARLTAEKGGRIAEEINEARENGMTAKAVKAVKG